MYRVDERGNVFYLVALQWADKMPFDVTGQYFLFSCQFLGPAFTKYTLSRIVGFLQCLDGMELGDRYQRDTCRQRCFQSCYIFSDVHASFVSARLSELFFNENGDRFYKIKVYFITLDEKSGAEKKTAAQMLAQASNLKDAIAVLEDGMKGTLADYTIASVTETQLMDVFPFDANSVPAEKKSEEELIAEQKKQAETKEA